MMMKDELIDYTRRLGFDAVGVARPEPRTWERFAEWIGQGRHGEMAYLVRHKEERRHLSSILDGVKSVIVIAKRYLTVEQKLDSPFSAKVSRYGWGEDYHRVIGGDLEKICVFITERTDGRHRARWCVDTAPALERDFAAQAGIGWVGKQNSLVNRSLGVWFFLGLVVTTLELETDEPARSHCGTCTRCLDACPSGALPAPNVLDARRCISYLTNSLKGAIPRDLRPLIGNRIFGCDECLEACPWNRFATPSDDPRFSPRHSLNDVDLIDILCLSPQEFNRRFKESQIKWTKRRGLLRNAAVALGNTRDPRAVPALLRALDDTESLIRGHAAWALGQIATEAARQGLSDALQRETDESVRHEIEWALGS